MLVLLLVAVFRTGKNETSPNKSAASSSSSSSGSGILGAKTFAAPPPASHAEQLRQRGVLLDDLDVEPTKATRAPPSTASPPAQRAPPTVDDPDTDDDVVAPSRKRSRVARPSSTAATTRRKFSAEEAPARFGAPPPPPPTAVPPTPAPCYDPSNENVTRQAAYAEGGVIRQQPICGAAVPTKRPRKCWPYDSAGTIDDFDRDIAKRSSRPGFFQGSPLIPQLPSASATDTLDVRFACDDYTSAPPDYAAVNHSGCSFVDANRLVATRLFNVFDMGRVARAIAESPSPNKTKACVKAERKRVRDVGKIVIEWRRWCIKDKLFELREMWDRASPRPLVPDAQATPAPAPTPRELELQRLAFEKTPRKFRAAVPNASAAAAAAAAAPTTTTTASPAPQIRPSLPVAKRRRILVCTTMQKPANNFYAGRGTPVETEEQLRRPPRLLRDGIRSFLAVARPSTDELFWLTDYSVAEWASFLEEQRRVEDRRRRQSLAFDAAADVAPHDSLAAARVTLFNVEPWKKQLKRFRYPTMEPPYSNRVYMIRHLLSEVLAGEHDGTIAVLLFADTRDVLYQTNPFDAVGELDLNRGDATDPDDKEAVAQFGAGAARSRARAAAGYLRGVFVAEEGSSHCCVFHNGGNTPQAWLVSVFGSRAAAIHTTCDDRDDWPDGSSPPLLCSGLWGGSFAAARDFSLLHASVLSCHDGTHVVGVDQPALEVAAYYGISAARFPHDVFVLSGNIGPFAHFNYLQSGTFRIVESTHTYVNCAGRPLSVLHQLDRKTLRYRAWVDALNARFRGTESNRTA